MNITYDMLFSKVKPQSIGGKIVQFPIFRILIIVIFMAPYLLVHNTIIMDAILAAAEPVRSGLRYIDAVISIVIILLLYNLYVRHIEKRKAHEISTKNSIQELGAGILVSLFLVGFMVALLAILGFYRVVGTDSVKVIVDGIFLFGIGAFIQELGFRLVLFRLLEELLGSWITLVVVALIFGIVHLGNPNATAMTTASLVLGDVMLAAAFIYTRRRQTLLAGSILRSQGLFGSPEEVSASKRPI
jgi:membrane protease YdiL (CAAX protease family)